jgi:hypothetical protein
VQQPGFAAEKAEVKAFATSDDVREFPKGRLELITIGGATVGRAVFEPGWRWATSVQPLVKTSSCEAPHFQYHVSGVNGSISELGQLRSSAKSAVLHCARVRQSKVV